jgi:putative ABC transport system permease protein
MNAGTVCVSVLGAALGGAYQGNRGRLVMSVLAIALGVALGFAVQLINQAAVGEFAGSMATLSGNADLEVRGPRSGFDETLFAALAQDPDIAVASAVVEVDARIKDRDDALTVYGVDAFRAGVVTPALLADAADPLDALRPDMVFLSPAAAAWLSVQTGDTLVLQSGLRDVPLKVAGLVRSPASQRYAVMDIAATQQAFDRVGTLTRIDLRVRPGVAVATLRTRLNSGVPSGLAVEAPRTRADATTRMSRAYRVNLNVLALVALFTGGLLVFSTQALSVVRRRAQFALLRTLGLTRRRLVAMLIIEGALVGAAGSLLGLIAGFALGLAAMRVFGGDLGAGFFRGVPPSVTVDPIALVIFGALGIAVAALGSAFPALEAARAAPAAALKAGDEQTAFPAAAPRDAWHSVAGRRHAVRAAAACGRPAAVRIPGDCAAAVRHAAAHATDGDVSSRAHADAALCYCCVGIRPAARRPGAGNGEPGHHRCQRLADGFDGHHGRLFPPFAGRMARFRPPSRPVRARGYGRRQRVFQR